MKRSLQQHFDEFLYEGEYVRKLSPETLKGYGCAFKTFIKIEEGISCEAITESTILHFFKSLQERRRYVGKGIIKTGIKKSTVATYWNKLNPFFKWLVTKRHLRVNPFEKLPYPTPSYDDRKFLQKADIEKIITAVHTHHDNNLLILKRNLVLIHLLLFCGLRKTELISLQVRDIDFDKKILTIRAATSKSKLTREIPLHSTLLMLLKDYMQARKRYTTPYLIVSSQHDEKLSKEGLKHLVEKLKKCSGVPFYLHQFRHTFAVNFLKSSNNIAKLKQLLGHKSILMTMTYLRCLPTNELRSDIECMSIDSLM